MSKPWPNIGAWAADAEKAEEEERQAAAAASATAADNQSFPTLREAAKEKPKKKKMSLSEFYSDSPAAFSATKLTPDEMRRLPTAPRDRSAEEMQFGRLGGGFSDYGSRSGPRSDAGDSSWGGRRSYGGGFDDDRRSSGPRVSNIDQPSRADEVANWAMTKKPMPSLDSDNRQNRYGGSIGGGGISRADEVDNWADGKKPVYGNARSPSFGSGFRGNAGPASHRWSRGGNSFREERPRLVLDPPKANLGANEQIKTNKSNPFGAARPREEVLAEKGLDWKKMEAELESKKPSSRPSSAHSSVSESQEGDSVVKPRPKVNPFGDAKPREVLLQERGVDWRKLDRELENRRVDRPETEEEKVLKAGIDHLKKELEKDPTKNEMDSIQGPAGDQPSLQQIIEQKEQDLETLIHDLDDKGRLGARTPERPGSGAGRSPAFSERALSSHSGSFDGSRSTEFVDRPRSRGKPDIWTRPGEERRAFQGGRARGFLGNRDTRGVMSRERW